MKQFISDNKLTSIIRAHEAQADGYKMHMVNKQTGIPRVITIFSAPNYCDVYKNKAACLKFDNNVLNIKQFIESPHPYYLPNFMDVFHWSLPFVAEKVTDMLANVLDFDDSAFSSEDEEEPAPAAAADVEAKPAPAKQRLKQKVLAITRVMRIFQTLRENNDKIAQYKYLTSNKQLPVGFLQQGDTALSAALSTFEGALIADEKLEHRPDAKPFEKKGHKRQESITINAKSRGERIRERRNSLPSAQATAAVEKHVDKIAAPKSRRHMRNVKSEDLSQWSPATFKEPAFKLTQEGFKDDDLEEKSSS